VVSVGWPWAAAVMAHVAAVPAGWIVGVAHRFADVPGSGLPWPAGVLGAALMIAALFAVRILVGWSGRHPRAAIVGAVVLGLGIRLPLAARPPWPPPGWLAVACDVGQGDGLVVAAGASQGIVIDTGPDPVAMDRCLKQLGINRIALVLLTHFHADHAEGLPGVLRGRSVGEIEVSPLDEPAAEVRRVRKWAAAAHVPVVTAAEDEEREVQGVKWRVVWPARIIRGEGSDPNNASVVLRLVTHGVTFLMTGDVEPAAQDALMRRDPTLLRADVLKVPHHGSGHQSTRMLQAVGAGVALISVGVGNPYGHPARSTLDLLTTAGINVGRTDTHGALAVVGTPGSIRLVTAR
jgi:competence protein ComEC